MRISKNTRPYKAGIQFAKALIETAHLLYLDKNILSYLIAIKNCLSIEIKRREDNGGTHKNN